MTLQREKGSPGWLPPFRDGSIVRFANQTTPPAEGNWGPIRMVYLQYASDPIVFFEASSWYREPEWLRHPRGPNLSPDLRWFPVVTMLQLAFDVAIGTSSPIGHGHVYAPSDHIDAWVSLTDPVGLTKEDVKRLKAFETEQIR